MSINVYDYCRIVDVEGYDNETPKNLILHSTTDSETTTLLKGKVFSMFKAITTLGKDFAATLNEAESKTLVKLLITKPDGTEIDLGSGNRISSSEEELYYQFTYQWIGFTPIEFIEVGMNNLYLEYKMLW